MIGLKGFYAQTAFSTFELFLTILTSRSSKEASSAVPETLVIYAFRNTDPEALNNLDFFLRHGIAENDGARYAHNGHKNMVLVSAISLQNIRGFRSAESSAI